MELALDYGRLAVSPVYSDVAVGSSYKHAEHDDGELPAMELHRLTLHSPSAYRGAIIPVFLNAYMPRSQSYCSYSKSLADAWLQPWSLASQASSDAIGLLQAACETGSLVLLDRARERLLNSLSYFQNDLVCSDTLPEALCAGAQALMLAEIYLPVSLTSGNLVGHFSGLRTILTPERLGALQRTDFGRFLRMSSTCFGVIHGLVHRQAMASVEESCVPTPEEASNDVERILLLALRLPGLLHRVDSVLSKDESHDDDNDKDVIIELQDFSEKIAKYASQFEIAQCGSGGNILDLGRSIPFVSFYGSPPAIAAPPLRFSSFRHALCCTLLWTCELLVADALLDMSAVGKWKPNQPRRLDLALLADNRAHDLWHTVPYLASSAGSATAGSVCKAMTCRSPAYFAKRWFGKSGAPDKAAKCTAFEHSIQSEVPYLNWDLLLDFGLFALPWLGT